jgi:AcrR family transcriptional regulator
MTDKKERILNAALELFANQGYAATSTSKIAKAAGVSEGLIFRHFKNKEGLLAALMDDIELQVGRLFGPIFLQDNPKTVIRKTIQLPFTIDESEYDYWRLQFKLKWESAYNKPEKMQPLLDKLAWAFRSLGYPEPELEAQLLNQILDGISSDLLKGNLKNAKVYQQFLLKRYEV